MPAIVKNIEVTSSLKLLHIIHYKFSLKSWQDLGQAIGTSKTLT